MTQQRSWGALLVAVGSVLAVLGASVAVFAFYAQRSGVPSPDSAKWFADEAVWAASEDVDGNSSAVTSLVGARGLDPVGTLPLPMEVAVRSAVADNPGSQMWTAVTTARYPNGNSLNVPEVYLATDKGVIQLVGLATIVLPVLFDPPVQVLPADVAAGRSWSQEGTAAYGSINLYDYAVESEILEVDDDGCVGVRASTTYTVTEEGRGFGGTDYDDTVEATLCPGLWITGYTSSAGPTTAVKASTARRLLADYEPPALADVAAPENAGRSLLWERDAGSGGSADTLVVPESQTVLDSDSATNTVSGVVWTRELPIPLWRLVGEGPTVVAPVRSGTTVVVADTHGLVTALDATSGFVLWQREVGRLPKAVALDANGLYVAVLDHSGSAELLNLSDGETVTSVDAVDDPVGIDVLTEEAGPLLVVADASSIRGYRADGEHRFTVEGPFTAGPVVVGDRAYAGTDDGRLLAIEADGDSEERAFELRALTDMVAGTDTLAVLDGEHLHIVATDDLAEVAAADDDADAISLGLAEGADTYTTTAHSGRITTYSASGEPLRDVRAPLRSTQGRTDIVGVQRAAAVSWDGVVWVSAVPGLVRWEAP